MPAKTAAAVRAHLEARYPDLDWDEVLSGLARTSNPANVADWLISVGCDADEVKKLCFDS